MARFSAEEKEGEGVGVLGFLRVVLTAAMGCFLGCFRMKDSHFHLVSTPNEHMVSRNKNALSSLFLSDEDDSDRKQGEGWSPLPEEEDVRELKEEAKFLKACGTELETPVEILKVSGKCLDMSTQKEESSTLNSWIPSASIEKLKLLKQTDESSTPVKICEEWVTGAGSLVGTPSSCMTTGHNTKSDSISSNQNIEIQNTISPKHMTDKETQCSAFSSGAFATRVRCTNKSVRFKCQSDRSTSSSEDSNQHSTLFESTDKSSVSKSSPYPTPLKLTDEMQTPGTVFPGYMNNIAGGKTAKIRYEHVYSNRLRESLKPIDVGTLISSPTSLETNGISVGNDRNPQPSLPSWVKPDSANQDGNDEQFSSTSCEKVNCGRTQGDRPILGMMAAHWNDKEATHVFPKWWDGNGIPNSTTKYKEDQKVSWHATPFEERLEKALSEDAFISQRNRMSGTPPVEYNESEECDTASSSQLQSSTHPKSIVSF